MSGKRHTAAKRKSGCQRQKSETRGGDKAQLTVSEKKEKQSPNVQTVKYRSRRRKDEVPGFMV